MPAASVEDGPLFPASQHKSRLLAGRDGHTQPQSRLTLAMSANPDVESDMLHSLECAQAGGVVEKKQIYLCNDWVSIPFVGISIGSILISATFFETQLTFNTVKTNNL